jgi:hypothetical protein
MPTQLIKQFNYSEGGINLNIGFDVDKPSHKEDIDSMISMLDQAKKDISSYRETLK